MQQQNPFNSTQIVFKGKAIHQSKEFIRAWCWATYAVLSFHGLYISRKIESTSNNTLTVLDNTLTVFLYDERQWDYHNCSDTAWGLASRKYAKIWLRVEKIVDPEDMAYVIVHEIIHMFTFFPKNSNERNTSTLTAKFKPTIKVIAETLYNNTYRNAAFLAHCKISYNTEAQGLSEDGYNQQQRERIGITDPRAK